MRSHTHMGTHTHTVTNNTEVHTHTRTHTHTCEHKQGTKGTLDRRDVSALSISGANTSVAEASAAEYLTDLRGRGIDIILSKGEGEGREGGGRGGVRLAISPLHHTRCWVTFFLHLERQHGSHESKYEHNGAYVDPQEGVATKDMGKYVPIQSYPKSTVDHYV